MKARRGGDGHEAPHGNSRCDGDASHTIHVCSSWWIERPCSSGCKFPERVDVIELSDLGWQSKLGTCGKNGGEWLEPVEAVLVGPISPDRVKAAFRNETATSVIR
jgi:hypothetical protein